MPSWRAYMSMNGVMIPGVSAGSNQVGASDTWTPQVICPSGAAATGAAPAVTVRSTLKPIRAERTRAIIRVPRFRESGFCRSTVAEPSVQSRDRGEMFEKYASKWKPDQVVWAEAWRSPPSRAGVRQDVRARRWRPGGADRDARRPAERDRRRHALESAWRHRSARRRHSGPPDLHHGRGRRPRARDRPSDRRPGTGDPGGDR